jgi:3,4-dihydroxyphthalate decarboxylase
MASESAYHPDTPEARAKVATACRILAARGLVDGILGHVSLRVSETELLVRCRGEDEPGLANSRPGDVWRVDMDGRSIDVPEGYRAPNELPIHTELMRRDPMVRAVVHAHPPAALLTGLAGLTPRPVFGAFNIPAMRLALDGIPVYPRAVLISRRELAVEMAEVMGSRPVCLLRGHGITVAASSVEGATTMAVDLDALLRVTVELARLGVEPPVLSDEDLAELPDLGPGFNERFVWQSLVRELEAGGAG